jgi:anti-sigma regulatory factor (Ser/Thr protein kinase)
MAAALQYFKSRGLQVTASEINNDVERTDFLNPRVASQRELDRDSVQDVIWRYESERQAADLCKAFIDQLEENIECGQGVLDALNWCLFEIMDNVFQHSHAGVGYSMLQLHYSSRRCAVAVSDDGIGIYESFRESSLAAEDEYDAIKLAVQEKVTSKPENVGNGLYGLMRVVDLNGGEMEIRSGRGRMKFANSKLDGEYAPALPVLDLNGHRGTTVHWQLDVSKPVSLGQALGSKLPNIRLKASEDAQGELRVQVSMFEGSLGARRSAEQVRATLVNILNERAARLVLDFENINVISSSFADEVLGKLALEMGFVQFVNRFRLENMSETVEVIINRAIQQRVAEGGASHRGSAGN